ncbi:MAG: hypothetical protein ACJ8AI_26330, partial [Rhodopila sp.]
SPTVHEPMMPIPGLELVPPPASIMQLVRNTQRSKLEIENEQLKALLREVLEALVALRAKLG